MEKPGQTRRTDVPEKFLRPRPSPFRHRRRASRPVERERRQCRRNRPRRIAHLQERLRSCDVQYRCTPLKTEEFIVVREFVALEGRSSIARGGSPWNDVSSQSEPCEGRPCMTQQ